MIRSLFFWATLIVEDEEMVQKITAETIANFVHVPESLKKKNRSMPMALR